MKEQSHKDEMSRALRGDFERLRERGVSSTLAPHEEPHPTAEGDVTEPPASPDEDTGPHSGWLERLLGR